MNDPLRTIRTTVPLSMQRRSERRTRRVVSIGATAIATTLAVLSPALAADQDRDLVDLEGMTEPVKPGEAVAVKPPIDPSLATGEKPGAADDLAAPPGKDSATIAAESAHERGLPDVMNDIYITSRVKMSLAVDARTPAIDINVDTTDARVTLFGIVPTEEAKFAAGADAASIAGVESVDNTLQVVPEERKPDVLARDAEVLGALTKTLEPFPSMRDVSIDVKNCVARLTGTIPGGSEHDDAMMAIRRTPGVCQVKDDLRFTAS